MLSFLWESFKGHIKFMDMVYDHSCSHSQSNQGGMTKIFLQLTLEIILVGKSLTILKR